MEVIWIYIKEFEIKINKQTQNDLIYQSRHDGESHLLALKTDWTIPTVACHQFNREP